jgi:hypothetical protein
MRKLTDGLGWLVDKIADGADWVGKKIDAFFTGISDFWKWLTVELPNKFFDALWGGLSKLPWGIGTWFAKHKPMVTQDGRMYGMLDTKPPTETPAGGPAGPAGAAPDVAGAATAAADAADAAGAAGAAAIAGTVELPSILKGDHAAIMLASSDINPVMKKRLLRDLAQRKSKEQQLLSAKQTGGVFTQGQLQLATAAPAAILSGRPAPRFAIKDYSAERDAAIAAEQKRQQELQKQKELAQKKVTTQLAAVTSKTNSNAAVSAMITPINTTNNQSASVVNNSPITPYDPTLTWMAKGVRR